MHVQVNSNHIPGSVELHEWVGTTVEDRLERFDDFLTRIEVLNRGSWGELRFSTCD